MSNRSNRFRVFAAFLVLACASAFAIAAISPQYFSLFTAQASEEAAVVESTSQAEPVNLGGCVGPIQVQSSGGTTTPTDYGTLKAAFDAIIAGTHTGTINIFVCNNTTETATAALTASGIGATSYTSVVIRPVGSGRVIEGSIVGAIVRLQGADNVTIDGRQTILDTARDLTIRNTNTSTATAAIWLSSVAAGNGASNNVIRNLEIAAGQTANTGTNTTIGVYMGGTTISLTATDGNDNDNNQFLFNRITRARYGFASRGVTTNNNEGLVVSDNIIGPNSFGADEIGKAGIYLQADTGAVISRNTVQFVGGDLANTTAGADRCGICVGGENWSVTDSTTITSGDYTVTKNVIHDIVEERTFSAIGIKLGTTRSGVATNNLVANNFIYNVRSNGTAGDQVIGIGISNGNGDRVVFNSISITGDMDPGAATASATYGNAIRIPGANAANNANFTVMNNSIYLDASSSSTAANRYYAITLNSAAYVFGTGGLNYNNYYINPVNTQLQTGGLGVNTTNSITTQFATLANWQAALTAPQDANSIQADPLYFSNTSDLHISGLSPNINAGTTIAGITDDIDGQVRPNGANPDIGADEFYPAPGTVQLNSATYSATEISGMVTITVTRAGGASGAVTVDYATSNGTATGGGSCGAGIDYVSTSGTLMWADNDFASKTFNIPICNDSDVESNETVNITLSNPTGGVTIGTPSSAVLTILNSVVFSGSVSVGTGEGYTSLTNPGGLFEAINNGSVAANTTVNITSDLTAETGTIALNQFAGAFMLTIQPSGGAARLISGSNGTALLNFNGADRVTIDGLNTGGNSLMIRSTGLGVAVLFINDASNNTVTRTTLEANANSSVVFISTGITTGNDNNSITNNVITGRSDAVGAPFNSINLIGSSAAISNTDTLINNNQIVNFLQAGIVVGNSDNVTFTNNDISQTASRTTSLFGVAVNSAAGTNTFSGNSIHDLTTTLATTGLQLNDARDTTVSRNRVYNFSSTMGSTGALTGIVFNGASGTPASVTVANNMISLIPGFTNAQALLGIRDFGFAGNTFNSYYNTVLLSGTGSGATNTYACVRGSSAPTAYTSINNICFNNRTGGTGNHFAAGDQSSNTGTFVSNYNIFVGTGATAANFFDKATSTTAVPVDFAGWQAGPPARDANSQASNPGVGNYSVGNMFVSTTDLHLANEAMNPASNAGTPLLAVTSDFDGNTRSASTPEIGADEFAPLEADLGVTKTDSPDPVLPGGNIVYTINFINNGPVAASSVSITDVLPANTTFVSASQTSGPAWTITTPPVGGTGSVTFTRGSAASSETAAFSITVNVNPGTAAGTVISNTATVASATTDPTPGNNSSTATTTVITPGTLQLSSATYSGSEGGNATILVDRVGGTSGIVGATYTLTDLSGAVGGPACTAGIDYINTGGTVTFGDGVGTSQQIVVPLCPDAVTDPAETFTVTISMPTGGAVLGSPTAATVTITDVAPSGGPVTVTATAGTPGPTDYPTLKDAIDAINAGTHQGAITVAIVTSTTETATSVLNSSGAGSALYTSVVIRPVNDSVTVAGPSIQGRGLIELNGADNVTIDGDNAATGGTNRNLTIQNTAANTTTFTSVIRIALNTTTVNSADNNIIRNLNIVGSATGRNVNTTVTTDSQNNTYGILATAGASGPTTAPTAIASLTTVIATGGTATNLNVSNNSFATAGRAVSVQGSATTVFPGLAIQNNDIGNPTAGAADQIYVRGISAQGSANSVISGNTVYVEGFIPSSGSSATVGIDVGGISANGTSTIERNKVNRVRNSQTETWATYGINIGGGLNHIVQNNFVSGVLNNQVAGTGGFGTTFGAYGIRVGGGTGHDIFHNSVHLYGAMPGSVSTNLTAAFLIVGTGQTGVDVRNNIFSNQVTGGNTASPGTRHVAVFLPAGTVAMNLTINNNAYFVSADPLARLAQVGLTFGAGEYRVADFDPTQTTPASNFRAFTSTLSAAGTNDNASFATSAPPPFTSDVDLHIPAGTPTRLESGGTPVGVMTDIDLETRNAATPDIGADEFAGNPPAIVNDIAAVSFVVPANGSTIPTGTFTPQARFSNQGTATQTNVTVRFRILNSSMVEIYNQTATIPSILPLQILTVSFPSATIAAAGAYSMVATAELAGDQNPANDTINGTFSTVVPLGGMINVGAGETYTSLTNPGGLFQALNVAGISGNTVVNITSDLTGETGAIGLNQLIESGAGGYTITFKPSGAARTITGMSAASNGLINLNGTDRVIFDGSLSGGTDRSLTITNTQTGTSTVFWIKSAGAGNGANSNTIKNCVINGTSVGATAQTTAGILAGSGVTIGGAAEAPNNDNTITNNWIYRVQNSLYNQGNTGLDQNWTITNNEFGSSTEADKNRFRGMLMGNANNFVISGNNVHGVTNFTNTTGANTGIQIAFAVTNGMVVNNRISDIHNLSATGTGAFGMQLGATPTTNIVIANNFIFDVQAAGSATVANNGHGITINGAATAGGYKIYHNSINMNTNQASGTTAALNLTSAVVAAGALDVRNNIFANTQTAGATRRAVHSAAAAAVFGMINYNDYFSTGSVGFIGGVDRPTLADWQTGTGQDSNSKSVDPLFVSPTDLHLQATSTLINMGVSGTGITTDIDGQTRDGNPDIGADEFVSVGNPGTLQFSSPTYTIGEAGPVATITVTRTGGTDGTVTVQYATVAGGTATGGATCGAGIDYQNTSGTLTFIGGDASETFDIPICQDATDEPNETVNLALTNPTGGATIGTPSTAVLTITDDDPASGSISINDVRRFEGDSGALTMTFTVTYTGPSVPASVQFATANGTAVAGVDYVATSGTLFFNAPPVTLEGGVPTQTQNVNVTVLSDILKEANETLFVNLSNPTNATITDGQGVGIIIDEDRPYVSDFDRDLKADFSVFRPSMGLWYVLQSTNATPRIVPFGSNGDIPVPGDYDGDGLTDFGVWRPSTGEWFVANSSDNTQVITSWGVSGDKPVQGDYDGDGKTDRAVFRPSTGTWWIIRSSNGSTAAIPFGISTDRPVQGDYDGDFKTDIAVYRNGTWYVARSSDGGVGIANFGIASDRPVSGDFDGDGKYDLAIYRDGVWWILRSLTGTAYAVPWGSASDIPVPADYEGDGTTDLAVFRPSTGDWYVLRSSDSALIGIHWGSNGDIPVPASYLPQ